MRDYVDSTLIYARDVDGTGSMHICSKEDPGAVEFTRSPPREFWIVSHDASAWDVKEQADDWAKENGGSMVHHVRQISEY